MIAEKPRKSFWQLFNLSFGFFGIQIGFALQNANMSRIFQSLGESLRVERHRRRFNRCRNRCCSPR